MNLSDIQLGPSVVLIRSLPDGEWVGLGKLPGAVEFETGADVRPFMRRGPTPEDVFHLGFGARVRTPVAQGSLEILERVIPGLIRGENEAGLRYVGGGYVAVARRIQPVQLAIVPVQELESGLDAPHAVHVWRAVPTIQSPLRWADVSEGIQSLTIEWIALRDPDRPKGADIFAIGPLRDVLTVPPEGEEPQDPPPGLEPPLYPGDAAPTLTVVDWNDGSAELLISPLQTSWPDPVLTGTRLQIVPRDAQEWIGSLIRDLVAHPDELLHIQIKGLPHRPMRARARHEYRSALPSLATEWSNDVQWGRFTVAGYKPRLSVQPISTIFLFLDAELPIEASVWGEIWQQCTWEIFYYRPGLGEPEWSRFLRVGASQNTWVRPSTTLAYMGPHYYRVRVRQSGPPGDVYSEWSDPLVFSPGLQDLKPSLSAQQIGAGQVMLQWSWSTILPAVEYWEIQRRVFPSGAWVHVETYADPGGAVSTRDYVDSGLAIGWYYYRVRGWRDGQTTAWSNEALVSVTQSAPIDPWIRADLDSEDLNDVLLEWGGVPGAREWQLQRKFGDGEWEGVGNFTAGQTSTRFEDLAPGLYAFRVSALLSNDEWSEWSIPASVTVPGAQQGLVRVQSGLLVDDDFESSDLGNWVPHGNPLVWQNGQVASAGSGRYALRTRNASNTALLMGEVEFSGEFDQEHSGSLLAQLQGAPGQESYYEVRYIRSKDSDQGRLRLARSLNGVYAVLAEWLWIGGMGSKVYLELEVEPGHQRGNVAPSYGVVGYWLDAYDTSLAGSPGFLALESRSANGAAMVAHDRVYGTTSQYLKVTGVPPGGFAELHIGSSVLSKRNESDAPGTMTFQYSSHRSYPGHKLRILDRFRQVLSEFDGPIYGGDWFHYTGN